MGWWTTIVSGAQGVSDSAKWVWNKAPLSQVGTYAANTGFHVLDQAMALRKAVPALTSKESRSILKGIGYTFVVDVLPVVAVNFVNTSMQNYFREGEEDQNAAWYRQYAAFLSLSALTLINYGVTIYTYRQGTKLLVHTMVLDSMGPSAFIEHKSKLPPQPSLCTELDCNFKRKFKGTLRQPVILAANDIVTAAIGYFIPYVGEPIAKILAVYFYGEYITRMVTPERCERHKGMDRSSLLALGLTYKMSTMLLDKLLEATIGMPPYLYYRTLTHFLLLLHINLAAHMTLPLVKPEKDTLPVDPLVIYEHASRITVDVIFNGLMKTIPILLKPEPNKKPFIPLSSLLQFLTGVFDSDLEKVEANKPGFFKQAVQTTMPRLFHSMRNTVNDPVISLFWTQIQGGILFSIDIVQSVGKPLESWTNASKPIAGAVKLTLPTALNYRFGLPPGLTKNLLKLCKEEDFWDFVQSLKRWCLRNSVHFNVILTQPSSINLVHGDKKIMELPEEQQTEALPPAQELLPSRSEVISRADELMTSRNKANRGMAGNASAFFTNRKRRSQESEYSDEETMVQEQQYS